MFQTMAGLSSSIAVATWLLVAALLEPVAADSLGSTELEGLLVNDTRPSCDGSLVFSLDALAKSRGQPFGLPNRRRTDFTTCVTSLVEDRALLRRMNATQALEDFGWVLVEIATNRGLENRMEAGDALAFWALDASPVELQAVLRPDTTVDCEQVTTVFKQLARSQLGWFDRDDEPSVLAILYALKLADTELYRNLANSQRSRGSSKAAWDAFFDTILDWVGQALNFNRGMNGRAGRSPAPTRVDGLPQGRSSWVSLSWQQSRDNFHGHGRGLLSAANPPLSDFLAAYVSDSRRGCAGGWLRRPQPGGIDGEPTKPNAEADDSLRVQSGPGTGSWSLDNVLRNTEQDTAVPAQRNPAAGGEQQDSPGGDDGGGVVGHKTVLIQRDPSSAHNFDLNERALMIAAIVIGSVGLVAALTAVVFYFKKVSTARVGLADRETGESTGGVQAGELRLAVVRQGRASRPAPAKDGVDKGQASAQL